jgi:photosystem II stability/assembly factor-like uncharacterized protein
MKKIILLLFIATLLVPTSVLSQNKRKKNRSSDYSAVPDSIFHGFKWRNIGPFRGGRSVASTGVVKQPMTYYFGSTGGGIWKTVDDGISWKNVSDGFLKTGTVGAIAVSESDPNVVFAGMGEHAARGVMTSMGDGIYKSNDAGKTWKHMGLDQSRHISDVVIHPSDPDIVFVSVQGAQYGPSQERGVYRSQDGGENWERVLFVDDRTGASSVVMDMTNPRILYAAMWEHSRYPWTIESGGPNSGLYKSSDGGSSWEQLKEGLPETIGKSGISVSRANPDRVFAVVEAEGDKAGVYRSDDAGKKWKQVNKDRINITRSWYYMEIFADPTDENVVWVMNAPAMKSIDGGKTFKRVSTPHGDNHHLWIHPYDNNKMINSNDGGANVSNNGGKSWSTQRNQPTSQFYRVITDNQVPYHVYGGQQDNSAIGIASRTYDDGIDWKDWYSVAGCESAFLAFDPDDPQIVFGGCYQGIIERWYRSTHLGKEIKEYPEVSLGNAPQDFKYRYNWNAPIISSPHDRSTIYHAGNVVFKTNDNGTTWQVISPDLTRNDPSKHGPGGKPFTNEAAGGENYNTLMALVESPHEEGVLWAGSDDGLVHITRDGGDNWENVTPANLPEGIINSIEVSPHDAATAYIAVMRYKFMDLKPYVFKTTNYGKNWSKIVNGFDDEHSFVRAVREDPTKKGLLYAGTETGLYVSFNDGQNWQKFQLNLPVVPINDLVIQNNDLVVATAGRSFWILDDLGPLQQQNSEQDDLLLFQPRETYLIFGGSSEKPVPGLGANPKSGVIIDYFLPEDADSLNLKLEVLSQGKVIRTITNIKPKDFKTWQGGPPKPQVLPSAKGHQRFTWDFRRDGIPAIDNVFVFGDYRGSRVGPGSYTLRLSLDGQVAEQVVEVLSNPNLSSKSEDYQEQQKMLVDLEAMIYEMHGSVNQMRSARKQLEGYKSLLKENEDAEELLKLGDSLIKRIDSWEKNLIQPDQKTFQDVINFNNRLNAEIMYLRGFIDNADPELTQGAKQRFNDLQQDWKVYSDERDAIVRSEMAGYNARYKELGIPAIILEE